MKTTPSIGSLVLLGAAAFLSACSGGQSGDSIPTSDAFELADQAVQGDTQEEIDVLEPDTPLDNATPETGLSRLSAKGKLIVNEDGETVVLKGLNLGGWLFHETWITQVDYALTSRISALGHKLGIGEDVDAELALGSPTWGSETFLDAFEPGLAQRIGAEEAAEFVKTAKGYFPGVYDDSDVPLRRKLAQRFGEEGRNELLAAFEEAWIQEKDIQWIAQQGFNVVRVPITYRSLVTGPDLDKPATLDWNDAAFQRLHTLMGWCEKHGVYAVIDIQESPGGHNDYFGTAQLYADPKMQELTVQLWVEIATRLGHYDSVAAYSLLAEPMGAPDAAARDDVYDKLVKAIRALGDDHLVVIHDGFLGMNTLPKPDQYGWTNVVYSTHLFEFSADSFDYWKTIVDFYHNPVFTEAQAKQNVPYYMGSFSARAEADWAYEVVEMLMEWFDGKGWSWSMWTYKRIDDPIEKRIWNKESSYGLVGRLEGDFDRPDVFDDDFETLKAKFSAYDTIDLKPNQRLLDVLTPWL